MCKPGPFVGAVLAAALWICGGCAEVCDECLDIHVDPINLCSQGLDCIDNLCIREGGNLPGECCRSEAECNFAGSCVNDTQCERFGGNLQGEGCSEGGAQCHEDLLCIYQTCEYSPIFPPTKELTQQTGESFTLDQDTLIILPENSSDTDDTAGQILKDQISASCGLDLTVRPYTEGDPPENSIVVGTPTSNPAVQPLLDTHSLTIPDEGPLPAENFAIKIAPSQILVAGRGDPGSLYGAQALKQYIRGMIPGNPLHELPAVTARDYPDMEQRMFLVILVHYYFPHPQVQQGITDGYKYMDIPFSLGSAYEYLHIMSELRYNIAILKMGDVVAWQNLPQPQNVAISVSDYLDLVREANDYGLETIPLINGSAAHNGWIATVEEPIEYTEEYAVSHYAEHWAIYSALVQEIIQAYDGVQPLRYFHAGMDEDFTFGPRPIDYHLNWVDNTYSLITSNNIKMVVWFDCWTATDWFINQGHLYPDMHVAVWDYYTPISELAKNRIVQILDRDLEVSLTLWGNGTPADFDWWFSLQDPLQKGGIGLNWVYPTACTDMTDPVFEETVNTYMRTSAHLFWNAEHLD